MPGDSDNEHELKVPVQLEEPQKALDGFWKSHGAEKTGHVRAILPPNALEEYDDDELDGSYNAAKEACVRRVNAIVRQCRCGNEMFTDSTFDLAKDMRLTQWDTLNPLRPGKDCASVKKDSNGDKDLSETAPPKSVHRVDWIFQNPKFAINAKRRSNNIDEQPTIPGPIRSEWQLTAKIRSVKKRLLSTRHSLASLPLRWRVLASLLGSVVWLSISAGCGLWWSAHSPVFLETKVLAGILMTVLSLTVALWGPRSTQMYDFSASHINQGSLGNCWWLCDIATMYRRNDLLQKVCVAHDQDCGVYGFCFYRDGGWIYSICDDQPALFNSDFKSESNLPGMTAYDCAREYRLLSQTGSKSLRFASCTDDDHTWLPLLEKAYAKAHGDYGSLEGGWTGEGLEDLTGGVTKLLRLDGFMNTDELWRQLREDGTTALFALVTPHECSLDYRVVGNHTYAILEAKEINEWMWPPWKGWRSTRLLKLSNPWGDREDEQRGKWQGPWRNGGREWSPWRMLRLRHRFERGGSFFMTFEDVLENFSYLQRTRLLDDSTWSMKQAWTELHISWYNHIHDTCFEVTMHQTSTVILVLSQLDRRYFVGLEGRYLFTLHFSIQRQGARRGEYIFRSANSPIRTKYSIRSTSAEVVLNPGAYRILVSVTAVHREEDKFGDTAIFSVEDAVRIESTKRPAKLQQIARNYDIAHRKLQVPQGSTSADAHAVLPIDTQDKPAEIEETSVPPTEAKPAESEHEMAKVDAGSLRHIPGEESASSETGKRSNDSEPSSSDSKQDVPTVPVSGDDKQKEEASKNSSPKVYSRPEEVAWDAVCGVGLRVHCHDPDFELAICRR